MKKYIFLLIGLTCLFSCKDDDDAGDSVLPVIEHFNFTFVEYARLPENSEPAKNKYFSEQTPAKDYLPGWLNEKVIHIADGSTATISYDYKKGDRSTALQQFEQKPVILEDKDYREIWGYPYVQALTPAKSPENILPALLKSKYPNATEGEYKITSYRYSEDEPVTIPNTDITYLQEGFTNASSLIDNIGWYNLSTNSQRIWNLRIYSNIVRAMATANGLDPDTQLDSWLISKEADLSQAVNPLFTFYMAVGYYTHHCISVLISSNYKGAENPLLYDWEDVTDEFNIAREGPEGYGEFKTAGEISLERYAGKKIHVAFRFTGQVDPAYGRCTAYELDDVLIYENGDYTHVNSSTEIHSLYQYKGSGWTHVAENGIYLLQAADYQLLNVDAINVYSASRLIPDILRNKFGNDPDDEKVTVIYKSDKDIMYADEFELKDRTWVQTSSLPLEIQTDVYLYKESDNTWIYENTIN